MARFLLIPGRTRHDAVLSAGPVLAAALHESNVLAMNLADMGGLGVASGDYVRVRAGERVLDVPCQVAELPRGIVALRHELFESDTRAENGIEVTLEPI